MVIKKTKKVLSIVLCFALMLTNFAFADNSSDIKGHWAESQINNWIVKGYVKGFNDGTIKPDSEISRVEFIVMVNRAFGFTERESISFKDVKQSDWFYSEIEKAKKAGYISGFSDGTFKPNSKISRQEAAIILARLFKLENPSNTDILATLKDSGSIPSWSAGAVNSVVSNGYMKGMPDKSFQPLKSMTRAEAIVTLDRCYLDYVKVTYDKAGTYSAETVEGSLEIKAADVTLQDTVINGNLVINKSVGDGNVNLKNVTVKGNTLVRGGGLNSIVAVDSTFNQVVIDKDDNKVRFVASGNTVVNSVDMMSGGKLEEQTLSGSGFGEVKVDKRNMSYDPISLVGSFAVINVDAANVYIKISGEVGDLQVNTTANNTTIDTAEYTKITSLSIEANIKLDGSGKVENAIIEASNIEVKIDGISITKFDVDDKASNTTVNLSVESRIYNLIVDALAIITGNGTIDTAQINVSGTKVEAPTTKVTVADGVSDVKTNVVVISPTPTPTPTPTTNSGESTTTPSAPSTPHGVISYSQEVITGVNSTMEYSTDNWIASADVVGTTINLSSIIPAAGSQPVTLKIRVKATPTLEQTLSIPARPTTPNYSIDFANEQIVAVAATDEYCADNFNAYATQYGTGANVILHPNAFGYPDNNIYIRKKATSASFKSDVQHLVLPSRPDFPVPGDGAGNTFRVEQALGTSGTRVTAQSNLEVSITRADGTVKVAWESGTPTGKDFPSAAFTDRVRVRVKATSNTFAGSMSSQILGSSNCKAIETPAPVISGVTIPAGNYKIGDIMTVTINADGAGYTAGAISINGLNVNSTLTSAGGNNYTVTYVVFDGNTNRATVSDIPISVVLYNVGTPCTPYTVAPTSSGTVTIDANKPTSFGVAQPTTGTNGVSGDGKSNVTVTWTDSISTDVNHYEIVAKVGSAPTIADVVTGKTNIAPATRTATFEWTSGADLYVGVVAVDNAGNKTLSLNATPNVTVISDSLVEAGMPAITAVNDLDANDDVRDFQVVFNAAPDESRVSEYRLMVMSTGTSFSFDLSDANTVTSDKYIRIPKTGAPSYTVNFASGQLDVDGSIIHTGYLYDMYVLAVADGANASVNTLSTPVKNVSLAPYIDLETVPDVGGEAKFRIVGYGDYAVHTYGGTAKGLLSTITGQPKTYYQAMFPSGMYYMIEAYNPEPGATLEAGDQITVTDDTTGLITISVTDGGTTANSVDGNYVLDVGPNGFSNYITFVIDNGNILVERYDLERIDLGGGNLDVDTFAIKYYHSGTTLQYTYNEAAGSVNLVNDGVLNTAYQNIVGSDFSYLLDTNVTTYEAGDMLTATDDSNGNITISVTDGGTVSNSLDGTYLLWVRDDNFGMYGILRGIYFTITNGSVTIQ